MCVACVACVWCKAVGVCDEYGVGTIDVAMFLFSVFCHRP